MVGFVTELFSFLKFCMIGMFALGFVFMILLALPRSPLRDFIMQALLWSVALGAGLLALSPVDFIPLLPFDNLLAGGVALSSSAMAVTQRLRQRREDRETQRREYLYMQARAAYEAAHAKTPRLPYVIEGEFHESPTR